MPRNIVDNPSAAHAFVKKCKTNDLRVVCVLTKPDEFVRYAGVDGLLEFYRLFIFRTYTYSVFSIYSCILKKTGHKIGLNGCKSNFLRINPMCSENKWPVQRWMWINYL